MAEEPERVPVRRERRADRERSADWERIKTPLLSSGNWGGHGLHLRGNVEGYVRSLPVP